MLNTLANHGVLPRDGKRITKEALSTALEDYVLLDSTAVRGLILAAFNTAGYKVNSTNYIDLDGLNEYVLPL